MVTGKCIGTMTVTYKYSAWEADEGGRLYSYVTNNYITRIRIVTNYTFQCHKYNFHFHLIYYFHDY